MAPSLLSIGAALTGRYSTYTIVKELHKALDAGAVCLARCVSSSQHLGRNEFQPTNREGCANAHVQPHRNKENEKCIVKSIRGHWRLKNEADILKRYPIPLLRPLVDEIQDPADPPSIVLQ